MLTPRVCALAAALMMGGAASASPFTLSYCTTPTPNGFEYTFTLTMDNHDHSWQPGYGIGWIVFGDSSTPNQSPLADFIVDPASLPIGPWTGVQSTGGGHNGPNLSPVVVQMPPFDPINWVPSAVGDHLTWRGTASRNVPAGGVLWSAIFSVNGPGINFEVATISCGPSCETADFNGDGDVGTDQDVEAFFSCIAGNCCPTCEDADFNGDGDVGTDQDIEAFFRVLAGGTC